MSEQAQSTITHKEKAKEAPLTITARGISTITRISERAILSVQVSTEGNDQEAVSREVTTTSKTLQKIFAELAPKTESGEPSPDAPVTTWNMQSLSTGSYRPRDAQGVDLDRRYTANSAFEVEFRDFGKLGAVTTQLLAIPNVSIYNTTWRLTEQTKESLGSQSRKEAVQDAMAKARDFAEAAGCKTVRPFEISDGYSDVEYGYNMRMKAGTAEDGELSFTPEEVKLKTDVTVKFYAE